MKKTIIFWFVIIILSCAYIGWHNVWSSKICGIVTKKELFIYHGYYHNLVKIKVDSDTIAFHVNPLKYNEIEVGKYQCIKDFSK